MTHETNAIATSPTNDRHSGLRDYQYQIGECPICHIYEELLEGKEGFLSCCECREALYWQEREYYYGPDERDPGEEDDDFNSSYIVCGKP